MRHYYIYLVAVLILTISPIYANQDSELASSQNDYQEDLVVNTTLNNLSKSISLDGKIAIYDIYFESGKYKIKYKSIKALNTIAKYLKNNSDKKFVIVGHTDSDGLFQSNIILSKQRANEVVNVLVSKYSISPQQISFYGVGSVSPVTSNNTEQGKAKNRRIELVQR